MKTKDDHAYRILIIDDNTAIHHDFHKILQKKEEPHTELQAMESALFGAVPRATPKSIFEIECAAQGKDGLALVEQAQKEGRPYALAFVDGRMPPGWDGVETIQHLWRICPELQIVICTAYADYSWQEIQEVLGESDSLLILKKPFDNIEVLQLTHALTRKWDLNRQIQHRIDLLGETVRERTEEKERLSTQLEAALQHSPSGIVVLNALDNETFWSNPAAQEICDPTVMFKMHADVGGLPPDVQICRAEGTPYSHNDLPLVRAIANGMTIQHEEMLVWVGNRQPRWLSCNASPIRKSNGDIWAGIIIFEEITERKQAEEEKRILEQKLNRAEKMEALGLLSGGVAHDLNNILSVVSGYSDLILLEAGVHNTLKSHAINIKQANQRAAAIIQDMLTMARRGVQNHSPIDINQIITGYFSAPEYQKLIDFNATVKLKLDLTAEPLTIQGSPIHLTKSIMNLAQNAAEAMLEGGTLSIKTAKNFIDQPIHGYGEITPSDYAVISVSDTGIGISEKDLKHIFEPFYTKKVMGRSGTGLGLAVVWGTVKDHNGYIDVRSEVGKGTTFNLYFPMCGELKQTEPLPENAEMVDGQGQLILIVDDEEKQRSIVGELLRRIKYNVISVASGEEAVTYVRDREVDLVILDMIMDPGIDGLETYQRILKIRPKQRAIIVSGFAETDRVRDAIALGANSLIKKPYSLEELGQAVKNALAEG
jgi:signal transduction histidine kinase/DNA-binding NtrC family response regulator